MILAHDMLPCQHCTTANLLSDLSKTLGQTHLSLSAATLFHFASYSFPFPPPFPPSPPHFPPSPSCFLHSVPHFPPSVPCFLGSDPCFLLSDAEFFGFLNDRCESRATENGVNLQRVYRSQESYGECAGCMAHVGEARSSQRKRSSIGLGHRFCASLGMCRERSRTHLKPRAGGAAIDHLSALSAHRVCGGLARVMGRKSQREWSI